MPLLTEAYSGAIKGWNQLKSLSGIETDEMTLEKAFDPVAGWNQLKSLSGIETALWAVAPGLADVEIN